MKLWYNMSWVPVWINLIELASYIIEIGITRVSKWCPNVPFHMNIPFNIWYGSIFNHVTSIALQILDRVSCCGLRLRDCERDGALSSCSAQFSTNLWSCCVNASVLLLLLLVCAWARPIGWWGGGVDPGGIGDWLEAADAAPDPMKQVGLRRMNSTKWAETQATPSLIILNNLLNCN